MNGQKLEQATSFKYLGATLCKDGTWSAEVRIGIAPGYGSKGQTEQDLMVQYHQLRKQVQAVQVSCHLHLLYG